MPKAVPAKTYVRVWLCLLLLLVATWAFSRVDLTPFNTAVALAIAFAKMILILLFFMHVRQDRRLIWIFASGGFFWLLLLIALTMSDYLTRTVPWSQ